MHSAVPGDPKNAWDYSIQGGQQIVKIQVTIQRDFLSKMCQNFMARLLGVALHLPWVVIHNIKSTHDGSYHLKGFQDRSMYYMDRS